MNVYKPLRAALLGYEVLRLLFLALAFAVFSPLQAAIKGGLFPYLSYLSPNALFPLICVFLLLRPGEYRNYLPLYMAGKIIIVVLFSLWALLSVFFRFSEPESIGHIERVMLIRGVFAVNFGDILSVYGIWILNRKLTQAENRRIEADGGL